MNTTALRLRSTTTAIALVLAAPLLLSACSTSSTSSPTVAETASGLGAKWGACMRDAGFDVQDPSDAEVQQGLFRVPEGADEESFGEQSGRCSEAAGVERADSSQEQDWARQYARVADCIRERGFDDFPEQTPGTIDLQGYPRAQEPEFEQVSAACLAEFAPDTQSISR